MCFLSKSSMVPTASFEPSIFKVLTFVIEVCSFFLAFVSGVFFFLSWVFEYVSFVVLLCDK